MTERFENWRNNAPKWVSALAGALNDYAGNDVVVPYGQVALAFPSSEPNPSSFDNPLIDHHQLRKWASSQGWQVRRAPEMAAEENTETPPVRFTRQPEGH